jgi:hypothetical protein
MLNDEIKKIYIKLENDKKKIPKSTQINLPNP